MEKLDLIIFHNDQPVVIGQMLLTQPGQFNEGQLTKRVFVKVGNETLEVLPSLFPVSFRPATQAEKIVPPVRMAQPHRGIQIGDGNSQTNVFGG